MCRKQRLRATYAFVFKHMRSFSNMLQAFGSKTAQICRNYAKMRLFLQSIRIAISFSSNRTKFYWSKVYLYLQYYYNIKNLVRKNKDSYSSKVFPRLDCFSVLTPFIPIILIICWSQFLSLHFTIVSDFTKLFTFKLITLIGLRSGTNFWTVAFSQSFTRKTFNST